MELIRLTFTGDILVEPEQYRAVCRNLKGFDTIFENLIPCFENSDFVVGNLETPLAGEDLIYSNHKWSFNTPGILAKSLKKVGFHLLRTANNHCLDRAKLGLLNTLQTLNRYGLEHIGTYESVIDSERVFVNRNQGGLICLFVLHLWYKCRF